MAELGPWTPAGTVFRRDCVRRYDELESLRETHILVCGRDGRFTYTHTKSEYDDFDGEASHTERRVRGTWTHTAEGVRLVGEQSVAHEAYKHCSDEDADRTAQPPAGFAQTWSRDELLAWEARPLL